MKNKVIAARVAKGAALLDVQRPGWDQNIDPDRLDLGECTRCVLGQEFGHFDNGCDVLYGEAGVMYHETPEYGFDAEGEGTGAREFARLTAAWRELIEARRSAS